MKKIYVSPNSSCVSIKASLLMLSNAGNASFKPDDEDDVYEGDFKSSRFEWTENY